MSIFLYLYHVTSLITFFALFYLIIMFILNQKQQTGNILFDILIPTGKFISFCGQYSNSLTNLWRTNSICISLGIGISFQRCISCLIPHIFTWTRTRTRTLLIGWTSNLDILMKIGRLNIGFELFTTTRHRKVRNSWTRSLIRKSVIIRVITEAARTVDNTRHLPFIASFIWTRLPGQCSCLFSIPPILILIIIRRTLRIWMIRTGTPNLIFMNSRALQLIANIKCSAFN